MVGHVQGKLGNHQKTTFLIDEHGVLNAAGLCDVASNVSLFTIGFVTDEVLQ